MSRLIEEMSGKDTASYVIKSHGVDRLPVDPFQIAERNGILIQERASDQPGVSGFLVKQGNLFGISYASFIKNKGFINFTVAHELGHYFLAGHPDHLFSGGSSLHASHSGFISGDKYESEADFFAANLLMPEPLFLNALRMAGEGFDAVQALANQCNTSITSTAIQFAKLAENPTVVIVTEGNVIRYCFMSESIRELEGISWPKNGSLIPPRSTTGLFVKDRKNIEAAREMHATCNLSHWIDGAPDIEVNEDVVGLGTYGRTLTILFTDELPDDEDEDS